MNVAALLDAIPGTASVTCGSDRVEEALSTVGEDVVASPMRFSDDFGFRQSVRRGNHVRTTFRVWVCRRRGGFGVFQLGEQCGPVIPGHLHCWFTVYNRGGGRRRDMNAAALLDAIPGTASVTCGSGFRLASDRGDAFKGFKRGFCPGRDFNQSFKSFVSARQSRGGSVWRRGGCCGFSGEVFRRFWLPAVHAAWEPREDDVRSVGVPSARRFWRLPVGWLEGHRVINDKPFLTLVYRVSYIKVILVVRRLFRNTSLVSYPSTGCLGIVSVWEYRQVACSALVVGGRTPVVDTGPQLVLFQCLTLGFSAGVPKGVRLGPVGCVTYRLWRLVSLHCSWLVVVERQLDLSSVTARLRGSSCALLSGLDTGVMNQ
ncbi:hypothetical protein Taro_052725 [Colocasia esculenta]|uniref:Uncharacterized protein n=1 Tax=Colocasia esculenta TaxID=4460 RepID=A0A843XJB5_COLES|nr:hypothetical protein [Colocasia esculenta]